MYFAHRIQHSWNCEFRIFASEIPMKLEWILEWEFSSFFLKANHHVYHFMVLMHEMQGTYANFNTVNSTRIFMYQIWKYISMHFPCRKPFTRISVESQQKVGTKSSLEFWGLFRFFEFNVWNGTRSIKLETVLL